MGGCADPGCVLNHVVSRAAAANKLGPGTLLDFPIVGVWGFFACLTGGVGVARGQVLLWQVAVRGASS